MSEYKQALKRLGIREVWGIDFETYYDSECSLEKLATTEYIHHPAFDAYMLAVQKDTWKKPKVYVGKEAIQAFFDSVDWSQAGALAHHAHFDGLIASHYFGCKPRAYLDTRSMAAPLMPITVSKSLNSLAKAFGMAGKIHAQALTNVKGRRLDEFAGEDISRLKQYAGDDIDMTWGVFRKLLPFTELDELRLISTTVKMYAQPRLVLDGKALGQLAEKMKAHKAALLERANAEGKSLASNNQFAELLLSYGVEPPTKISKTTGEPTYAFAKTDLELRDLLEHPNEDVRILVEARLGVKSTATETRAERLSRRAAYGPASVYLNYWGAKTGRWSGGDKANWQNLTARGDTAGIREMIHAPRGHKLIIADLSQIEARMNAWFSGQADMLQMFADGIDVYCAKGSQVFGRTITKADTRERFISKTMVLMLQYGAGGGRFYESIRAGGINLTEQQAHDYVKAYRSTIPFITANWRATMNSAKAAFVGKQRIAHNVLTYEGANDTGYTHMPNGTAIRYDGLSEGEEGLSCLSKAARKKNGEVTEVRQRLYGGLLVENNIQSLARHVMAEHMLAIEDALPEGQIVMSTHDEVVVAVPTRTAKKALKTVTEIMSTPPKWASDLPIAVEGHISDRYDK